MKKILMVVMLVTSIAAPAVAKDAMYQRLSAESEYSIQVMADYIAACRSGTGHVAAMKHAQSIGKNILATIKRTSPDAAEATERGIDDALGSLYSQCPNMR